MAPVQQEEVSEEETFCPLTLKNEGCRIPQGGNETDWDLGAFAAVLAQGQTPPQATEYEETIRD